MDNPFMTWLPELEMEGPGNGMQHQQTRPYYSDLVDSFSCQSFNGCPNAITRNQSIHVATINSDVDKQLDLKASNISPFAPSHSSSPDTFTISFGNSTLPQETNQIYRSSKLNCLDAAIPEEETRLNEFLGSIDDTTRFRRTRRNERQVQEHVLAERKRREKLAERFNSLSALLPGIKRMDKADVLEGARKHIIQLQTRVKQLEETSVKGKDIVQESGVSIGISKFYGGHEDVASSSDDTNYLLSGSTTNPEIKAIISGSKMLVRIYCMESSSIVLKTLTEMERLHIMIDCCSVLPFGTSHLVTINAQFGKTYATTEEHDYRLIVFKSNLRRPKGHQLLDPTTEHGVTKFSDLTASEFRERYLGLKSRLSFPSDANKAPILPTDDNPEEFDWHDQNLCKSLQLSGLA